MPTTSSGATAVDSVDVVQRLGALTRNLHDALKELGYDKAIANSIGSLPDARSRLSFIARLTGEAAEKVLDTVDTAQSQQAALVSEADRLEALAMTETDAKVLRDEALRFVGCVRSTAQQAGVQLTEIMLAQDFHDLTGQTVRKVVDIATRLEESLVQLLMEAAPLASPVADAGLQGPVADPTNRADVVSNQAQVDEMLESLGF